MRPINVVLAQSAAPPPAKNLAARLRTEFRNIAIVQTSEDLRSAIARSRGPIALVDLELISVSELKQLCSDFPATAFVAIHRLADEQMWAEALAAGAVDCCVATDVSGILRAADRYAAYPRARAAAA